MHLVKYSSYKYISCNLLNATRLLSSTSNQLYQSAKASIDKHSDEKAGISKNFNFENLNVTTKSQRKLPNREPLLKNLFMGRVDNDLLAFPEAISKDDLNNLYTEIEPARQYFNSVDSDTIDQTRLIPKSVIEDLKNLKLFANVIPQVHGGRGYYISEACLSSEPEAEDINIASILNAHRAVVQILNDHGTENQKKSYLSKLAKGDLVASIAIFESNVAEEGLFLTTAKLDETGNSWSLNGQKSYVVNGPDANLLIVLAQTETFDKVGDTQFGVTIFLVETDLPGITKGSSDITMGCRGVQQTSIKFENVSLSPEKIIGQVGMADHIAQALFKIVRLQSGVLSSTLMKKIIKNKTEFCVRTKAGGIELKDLELFRERLAKSVCSTYAIESMTYLTAGLLDIYDGQDVDLEAAATKAYALESLWEASSLPLYYNGPGTLLPQNNIEKNFRDSAQLLIQNETIDSIKLYIGLSGLQHAGMQSNELIKKIRNPIMNPGFIISRFLERKSIETPKLTLKLNENLHPSLEPPAQFLEFSILRLQMATEILLARHGASVIEKQVNVIRLADCVIQVYAMFASIARASRAYCIGLKNADYEMLIAGAVCVEGMDKVKAYATEINKASYETNEMNYHKIAKQLFKSKGYFLEHPLTRNF